MDQFQPLKSKCKKKKTTAQDNIFEKLYYLSEPTLCSKGAFKNYVDQILDFGPPTPLVDSFT